MNAEAWTLVLGVMALVLNIGAFAVGYGVRRSGANLVMLAIIVPEEGQPWLGVGDLMQAEAEAEANARLDKAAEIARREWLGWGKIPLTNLRADIDYHQTFAQTMAGSIGVKVWIYRGDVFGKDRLSQYNPTTPERRERREGGRGDFRGQRRDGGRGGFGARRPMGAGPRPQQAPAQSA